jgi:hypothetical protein
MCNPIRRSVLKVPALILIGLFASGTLAAAEEIESALTEGVERTEQAQTAQQQIDDVSRQVQTKLDIYRNLLKEEEGLEVYIRQLEVQAMNQVDEIERLEQSIDKVTVIERQITPLMLRMIDALEQFVSLDMPFLKEERENRVARLKGLVERADVTVAEKFRNVLQAYQTEIEYGRTIEAYRGALPIDGEAREVDFLRIGRIALVYQALDGESVAAWNPRTEAWEALDSSWRNQVRQALRIAREQAAPDLVRLPVPTAMSMEATK